VSEAKFNKLSKIVRIKIKAGKIKNKINERIHKIIYCVPIGLGESALLYM
jgi:hypothetical protein